MGSVLVGWVFWGCHHSVGSRLNVREVDVEGIFLRFRVLCQRKGKEEGWTGGSMEPRSVGGDRGCRKGKVVHWGG